MNQQKHLQAKHIYQDTQDQNIVKENNTGTSEKMKNGSQGVIGKTCTKSGNKNKKEKINTKCKNNIEKEEEKEALKVGIIEENAIEKINVDLMKKNPTVEEKNRKQEKCTKNGSSKNEKKKEINQVQENELQLQTKKQALTTLEKARSLMKYAKYDDVEIFNKVTQMLSDALDIMVKNCSSEKDKEMAPFYFAYGSALLAQSVANGDVFGSATKAAQQRTRDAIQEGNNVSQDENSKESKVRQHEGDTEDLQIAWKVLEMARLIYSFEAENAHLHSKEWKEHRKHLARVYQKLGELCMETENWTQSYENFSNSLKLYKQFITPSDRIFAIAHTNLAVSSFYCKEPSRSLGHYRQARLVFQRQIVEHFQNLKKNSNLCEITISSKNEMNLETEILDNNVKNIIGCINCLEKEVNAIKKAKELSQDLTRRIDDLEKELSHITASSSSSSSASSLFSPSTTSSSSSSSSAASPDPTMPKDFIKNVMKHPLMPSTVDAPKNNAIGDQKGVTTAVGFGWNTSSPFGSSVFKPSHMQKKVLHAPVVRKRKKKASSEIISNAKLISPLVSDIMSTTTLVDAPQKSTNGDQKGVTTTLGFGRNTSSPFGSSVFNSSQMHKKMLRAHVVRKRKRKDSSETISNTKSISPLVSDITSTTTLVSGTKVTTTSVSKNSKMDTESFKIVVEKPKENIIKKKQKILMKTPIIEHYF